MIAFTFGWPGAGAQGPGTGAQVSTGAAFPETWLFAYIGGPFKVSAIRQAPYYLGFIIGPPILGNSHLDSPTILDLNLLALFRWY